MALISLSIAAAEAAADTDAHSVGILQDTSFWVLLAFAIVIGIFLRAGLPGMLASNLDKRAQKIADDINEARKLREEAQELLATYQRRQRDAEDEAKAIIDQAKADATQIEIEARAKISEQIERRMRAAEEKIARAEAQAMADVRGQTADLAIEAARDIIRERMDSGAQNAMIDRSIAGLRSKLN